MAMPVSVKLRHLSEFEQLQGKTDGKNYWIKKIWPDVKGLLIP